MAQLAATRWLVSRQSNWIPTVADKAYFRYFRFYGPQPPLFTKTWKLPDREPVQSPHAVCTRDTRMRTLVQRLKRLWNTPVEFYGVDRPEPQAGPWHGLLLFVVLLVVLGLLWLIRYLPERTYLVQLPSMSPQGRTAAGELGGGQRRGDTVTSGARGKTAADLTRLLTIRAHDGATVHSCEHTCDVSGCTPRGRRPQGPALSRPNLVR
jgi:hypothetical protein